jgi:phosphatidylglycerol---prolipoprotein diacylglyceryl transferase
MLKYPQIDPVFLTLGPIKLRWYGLMYIIGIMGGFKLAEKTMTHALKISKDAQMNLLSGVILGVLLGGRIGYIVFYDLGYYLHHPSAVLAVWQGGMSYHGGAIGALLGLWISAKTQKLPILPLMDILAWMSCIGIGLGRIANFINGELYGHGISKRGANSPPSLSIIRSLFRRIALIFNSVVDSKTIYTQAGFYICILPDWVRLHAFYH